MTRFRLTVVLLTAVIIATTVLALGTGSAGLGVIETVEALFGKGESVDVMIVQQWRLPRAVAAIAFGAALAVAGSLMQNATRNPLGSPDIIGFDTGAFTGVLIAGILLGSNFAGLTAGALAGGMIAAAVVVLVARLGGSGAFRVIIVGIAMSAFLTSVNTWIILAADVKVAMSASSWALGSLNDVTWDRVVPAAALVACCALPAGLLTRPLHTLAVGDALARGLGVDPPRVRLWATVLAVLLAATVVAVTGPIAFVALAAPHLASLMTGRRGYAPLAAALTGAALLSVADLIALRLIPGAPLPVGAVTVSVGGVYLIVLIAVSARQRKVVA